MLSPNLPLTDLGERALSQLVAREYDYGVLASDDLRYSGSLGRHDAGRDEARYSNAVVDFVAIGESFVSARLLTRYPSLSEDDVFTWDKRRRAWRRHGGIDLTSIGGWQPLMGYVEVRNSLQHGLGRLTDFQLKRRDELFENIGSTGVLLLGDRIHLDGHTVRNCFEVVRDFTVSLDASAGDP